MSLPNGPSKNNFSSTQNMSDQEIENLCRELAESLNYNQSGPDYSSDAESSDEIYQREFTARRAKIKELKRSGQQRKPIVDKQIGDRRVVLNDPHGFLSSDDDSHDSAAHVDGFDWFGSPKKSPVRGSTSSGMSPNKNTPKHSPEKAQATTTTTTTLTLQSARKLQF
jgi:hypothetical protein